MSAMSSGVPVRPNGIILWRAVVSASKPPPGIARYGVHANPVGSKGARKFFYDHRLAGFCRAVMR